ncbi:hypothetical protein QJS66_05910 [Kocuria rhizophila]|nr:hypothetical protein QJS66_05910 [Kocuria rhizophila]
MKEGSAWRRRRGQGGRLHLVRPPRATCSSRWCCTPGATGSCAACSTPWTTPWRSSRAHVGPSRSRPEAGRG